MSLRRRLGDAFLLTDCSLAVCIVALATLLLIVSTAKASPQLVARGQDRVAAVALNGPNVLWTSADFLWHAKTGEPNRRLGSLGLRHTGPLTSEGYTNGR